MPLLSEPIRVNPIESDVTGSTQCTALTRAAATTHRADAPDVAFIRTYQIDPDWFRLTPIAHDCLG